MPNKYIFGKQQADGTLEANPEDPAGKIPKTMAEFGMGTLRSGSSVGPKVKSKKQALAIALSQAKKYA